MQASMNNKTRRKKTQNKKIRKIVYIIKEQICRAITEIVHNVIATPLLYDLQQNPNEQTKSMASIEEGQGI